MVKKVKNQPDELTLSREREAFDLRARGWTQQRIADHMEMSQGQISAILTRVNKKYTKLFMDDVKNIKADQVSIHSKIVDEALDAWEKSKSIHKVTKNKAKGIVTKDGKQKPSGGETSEESKQLFGDTKYLDSSMRAMEHIRKIVGVELLDTDSKDPMFGSIKLTLIGKDGVEIKRHNSNNEDDDDDRQD